MRNSSRFLILVAAWLPIAWGTAAAQTSFGPVNVGSSAPLAVTFNLPAAATLGSISVVTQGAASLDFTDTGTGTCAAGTGYLAGQTCTVDVNFKPLFAGTRYGAALLKDQSGNLLASVPLVGIGMGPQIAFDPGAATAIDPMVDGTAFKVPFDPVVDGRGDLFVTDTVHARVVEIPAGGGAPIAIDPSVNGQKLKTPGGVAVDGAGDLFISDLDGDFVMEVPAGGGAPTLIDPVVNGKSLAYPCGMVIDGAGNLYIADVDRGRVVEIPAGGGPAIAINPMVEVNGVEKGLTYPVTLALDGTGNLFIADQFGDRVVEVPEVAANPSGAGANAIVPTVNGETVYQPYGVAVDAAGNLFIADAGNDRVVEVPAGGGAPVAFDPTVNGEELNDPIGIALDPAGDLFIADSLNNRVVQLQRSQPPALNFAQASVGSTSSDSPQTVEVENVGNAPLTFPVPGAGSNPAVSSSFTLKSGGTSDCPLLNAGSPQPGTLAAGASCLLPIGFVPTAAGAIDGTLTLTDNTLNAAAPAYAAQAISLSGDAPVASLSAASLSFGPQQVGTTSTSQQVTLANTGSAPLAITSIAVTGANASAFAFPNPCGSSLAAGANCVIQGTFTPAAAGAMPAALTVTDNAGGPPQTVNLTGAGVYVPTVAATPSLSNITTAQALTVTVAAGGQSGYPTPTGSIALTSGSYSSPSATLSSGSAAINVPAGSLAVGTDSLVATYTPDAASASTYSTASDSISVTVTAASTATAPAAITVTPTAITAGSATLAGTVNPNGADTQAWFLWGASSTLSGAAQTAVQDLGSGNSPSAVSAAISGLNANTTYYYQVVAQNSVGKSSGSIFSFTTIPAPYFSVSNGTPVSVAPGAATGNLSTITVTPWYGFAGNVTLTAAITSSPTGAVSPPTLSFGTTSPLSISGASTGTATLTISTTAALPGGCTAADSRNRKIPGNPVDGAVLACVLLLGIPRRRRWVSVLGMVALLVALAGGMLACGGGSGEKACSAISTVPATTAGNYTITLTAASGSMTESGTVALTVQ